MVALSVIYCPEKNRTMNLIVLPEKDIKVLKDKLNFIEARLKSLPENYELKEKLLTPADVCDLLKISRRTLSRLMKENKLSCVKVGRKTLFKSSSIKNYLNSNIL